MSDKKCPICSNFAPLRLIKSGVEYNQCTSCRTLFSAPLDNSGMVGGGNEVVRNVEQNHLRIDRINTVCHGMKKSDVNILDFGCGNFMLGNDLIKQGYNCDGYDAYNDQYSKLPERDKYDIVTAIEVIEHTSTPFVEVDVMHRSLRMGGILMIESSYVEIADQENIALEDFFYINPEVGHATIFSWHGLDLVMALKGFRPLTHWNRHVRGFQKTRK